MVSDDKPLHVRHLYPHKNAQEFVADMDFLAKRYSPIGVPELIGSVKGKTRLPRNAFLLTFDDGFREIHDVIAPILREKGIPAVFFLNSAFIDNRDLCYQHKASILAHRISRALPSSEEKGIKELLEERGLAAQDLKAAVLNISYQQRNLLDAIAPIVGQDFDEYLKQERPYLTSEQIKSLLAQGLYVGGHGVDHAPYASLSLEAQLAQTIESVTFVREKFNLDYGAFAFPHSDAGVSNEFFRRIYESGMVDVSFGTGGMLDDEWPCHIQRFSLEKPPGWPASRIIRRHRLRRAYKRLRVAGIVYH
jgi:peptidoglycan/xylan/chitin deacetylase (PgdA/CDA1 family)